MRLRSKLPPILLVLVALISHRQWFNPYSILTHSDWYFWPSSAIHSLAFTMGTWIPFWNHGAFNVQMPFITFMSVWAILGRLGISFDIATKLTFFIPIALLGFLSPYYLVRKLVENEAISFCSALYYGSSTYFLVRQTAHLPIAMVFALAPLLLLAFIRALEKNTWKSWILFCLLYSIGIGYEIRIMLIVTFILLAYFCLAYKKYEIRVYKKIVLAAAVLILLNLYWLIPTLLAGTSGVLKIADRGLFGDHLFNIQYAISATDSSWTGRMPNQNFIPQAIPLYAWVTPLLALSLFLLRKAKFTVPDRRFIYFFLFLLLVGIFLTKQAGAPLEGAYEWLYLKVPGFNLFREASKFYLLVTFGYTGLIAYALKGIRIQFRQEIYFILCVIMVMTSFLNLKPLLKGEMGTLFVNHHQPKDYQVFDGYLNEQPSYFRTLWLPTYSRWSTYDSQHPEISIEEVLKGDWQAYDADTGTSSQLNMTEKSLQFLAKNYASNILSQSAVKYVVVPIDDTTKDDNFFHDYGVKRTDYIRALNNISWLKKINIGTANLDIYENTNYNPHISSTSETFNVVNYDNLNDQSSFLNAIGFHAPSFIIDPLQPNSYNVQSLLVNPITKENPGTHALSLPVVLNKSTNNIYKNISKANLSYRTTDKTVELFSQPTTNPSLDGIPLNFPVPNSRLIATLPRTSNTDNSLLLNNKLEIALNTNTATTQSLGLIDKYSNISLIGFGENNIPNSNFEKGLWQPEVGDCNNYDNNGKIYANIISGRTKDSNLLELDAIRHTACMATTFNILEPGQQLLSFDYSSMNSKLAGYFLAFNDDAKTTIRGDLAVRSRDTEHFSKILETPHTATTATLVLYAYESDGNSTNSVIYSNVKFRHTVIRKTLNLSKLPDEFVGLPLPNRNKEGTNEFSLDTLGYDTSNIIYNPSFEKGFWTSKVSDCNNHDNKPKLSQNLDFSQSTDGRYSLQLESTRHNACTSTIAEISSSGDYSFSFDYKGENAKSAGYYLQFNDPRQTVISESLPITTSIWQKLSRTVHAPLGATAVSLTIYAYETDGKTNSVVNYDNFYFSKIPDISNTYYLLTEPTAHMKAPKNLSFESVNPTKQQVSVEGATDPFILLFAETFDPGWKLYLRPINHDTSCVKTATFMPHYDKTSNQFNGQVNECQSQLAFGSGEDLGFLKLSPIFDKEHIKINGFANGWTVDPSYIKSHYGSEYYHENPDGSLDFNMVIYFKPQSYFYIGLGVSLTTLGGCAAYLGYPLVRRRLPRGLYKAKRGYKIRGNHRPLK